MKSSDVCVETYQYERDNGKLPRGFGQWAFRFDHRQADPRFAPGPMLYGAAVKWAKVEAAKRDVGIVYVCS